MATTTQVPPIQFTPAGVVLPQESAILAGVQADWNTAFGGNLNPALSTPQGQVASSTTAIIAEKNSEIALIANQVDPQYATGRWQDAIGRIYFMTRLPSTSTAVTCTLGGLPGTPITAGTLAQDKSNNTYVLLASVTIGTNSTVTSQWQNIATGPIACPAGTLTKVYQAISGWDTITNPTAGVPGQNVETPAQFELRRKNSVAANGQGSTQAIKGNIWDTVANVLDVCVVDNPSGVTVLYGSSNYPLKPNSVYVGVVGGAGASIAQAIWDKKDLGCNYNGNTSVVVTDARNNASYPVTYNVPTDTPLYFAVQIAKSPTLPANIETLIQDAIIAQFQATNTSGAAPAKMKSTIIGATYYAAILASYNPLTLLSVFVGLAAAPTATQVIMGIDQEPTISADNITVSLVTL